MYKIIYKKENGEVIERVRNTLPLQAIGETTSMGWLVVDILYSYRDGYYNASEYHTLCSKQRKKNQIRRNIITFIKKYRNAAALFLTIFITKQFM